MRRFLTAIILLLAMSTTIASPFAEDLDEAPAIMLPYGANNMVVITTCDYTVVSITIDVNLFPDPRLIGQTLTYLGNPAITSPREHQQDMRAMMMKALTDFNPAITILSLDKASGMWRCA